MTHYRSKKIYSHSTELIDDRKNTLFLNVVVFLAFMSVVVFYFIFTNQIIERNFKIISLKNSLKEEQAQHQNLEVAVWQTHSLSQLAEKAKNFNLVSIDKIKHLKIAPNAFAFLFE